MQHAEILTEIIRLPLSERIAVIESALVPVRKELHFGTYSGDRIGSGACP